MKFKYGKRIGVFKLAHTRKAATSRRHRLEFCLILVGTFLSSSEGFSTPVDLSESFTYQGRFLSSDGSSALTEVLSLQLSIYDPSATCLLYQESQSIDTTSTNGLFAVNVGSVLGDTKRSAQFNGSASLDPGLTMATIFSNTGQILAPSSANCTAGYTPAAGDGRLLRVTLLPSGDGVTTLTPDLEINSVPMAKVAEVAQTLQGFVPGTAANNLVQLDGSGRLPAVNGSLLTNISAGNVTGALPTISGASLTNLSASSISSGTLNSSYLPTSGVTAGTYTKLTVDSYGRATSGASLASGDVTGALGFSPAPASGSANYAPASGSANYAPASGSANYAPASGSANYAPASGSANYAPASGSANYAPASGSANYAPASGSANYAPASGSANYLSPTTAASTYLTQSAASTTYAPLPSVQTQCIQQTAGGFGFYCCQMTTSDGTTTCKYTSSTSATLWNSLTNQPNLTGSGGPYTMVMTTGAPGSAYWDICRVTISSGALDCLAYGGAQGTQGWTAWGTAPF